MKLTVLGRWSPFPPREGACPAYLLQNGNSNVLLDCGSGAVSRLHDYVHYKDLTAIVLSHLHGDHMSDLLVLKYALDYARMIGLRDHPVPVYAPAEPAGEFQLLTYKDAMVGYAVEPGDVVKIGCFDFTFVAGEHAIPSNAMRIESGGKVLVYSGDTAYTAEVKELAGGADLFLCEAGMVGEANRAAGHLTPVEAGLLGKEARVKRLLLTHFKVGADLKKIRQEAEAGFDREVDLAEELVTYII